MPIKDVAIIGAGLCGLTLAIALHQHGIISTVYETRPADAIPSTPGTIVLSPNALRSLDSLGLYARLAERGYRFRRGILRHNIDHAPIDTYYFGDADRYGYDALRIHRSIILEELRAEAAGLCGVRVLYGKKFRRVLEEDDGGVRFACVDTGKMNDGEQQEFHADVVIGADGIHSVVRNWLYPDGGAETVFEGIMSLITAVPAEKVRFPNEGYEMPTSIHGAGGAFLLSPQGVCGDELLLAIQHQTHARDRAGWEALLRDKGQLYGLMRDGYEAWNDTVRSALDAVEPEKIFVWPFYSVPRLENWTSAQGKVVLLGDAAHAIPPAAGQGINQGFEDVHSLALLVATVNEERASWEESLSWWQRYRQTRVDRATDLTHEMSRRRIPGWSGNAAQSMNSSDLYGVTIEEDVRDWLSHRT